MLVLHARLRFGVYDAGSDTDPREPEWPPHPARLFCALVASDPTEEEWRALEWLESQPPPLVAAPPLVDDGRGPFRLYVPTNDVAPKSPSRPGRTNRLRLKPRAVPSGSRFALIWPDAAPDPSTRATLDSLAARVPYVGRSTASAEVWFDTTDAGAPAIVYEPVTTGAEVDLRVPYPGYVARLIDLHETGGRAWEASRAFGYRLRTEDEPAPEQLRGPFDRFSVLRFVHTSYLHSSRSAALASLLRDALMAQFGSDIPAEISGHGVEGRPHVAYVALPNVGWPEHLPDGPRLAYELNRHADGRVLGMALAFPRGAHDALRRALRVLRADDGLVLRWGGGRDQFPLRLDPVGGGPRATNPRTWLGPSDLWATATPVVLDRFPKRRNAAQMVAEALVTAGYPEPVEVVASRAPILPGAPRLSPGAVQRRAGVPVKPWVHAWVRFEAPLVGPVLAGSMRYRGLGLFTPLLAAKPEPEEAPSNAG